MQAFPEPLSAGPLSVGPLSAGPSPASSGRVAHGFEAPAPPSETVRVLRRALTLETTSGYF